MKITTRSQLVEKVVTGIKLPRLQISVILAVTALSGFLTSVVLLRLGVTSMTLRYPLAVIGAYCVFLILLRIWIWWNSEDRSGVDLVEPIDLVDGVVISDLGSVTSESTAVADTAFSGGGKFAGAGAGGAWSEPDMPRPMPVVLSANPQPASAATSKTSSAASSSGGGFGFDIDLDDGIALVIVIVVIALVLSALIYIVWVAPILFAELLIDTALVGGLYGTLKGIERRHWLWTALRKTGIAALIVVILLAIAGFAMEAANPDAVTIGQFFRELE